MSDETLKLIASAVIVLCEVYTLRGGDFPFFAYIWDIIARITGCLANVLGHISVTARYNYFVEVGNG